MMNPVHLLEKLARGRGGQASLRLSPLHHVADALRGHLSGRVNGRQAGGAKRPRYGPGGWTALSADGVRWNPPCLPHELGW